MEFLENRPMSALDTLVTSYPLTPQAGLAQQVLSWRQLHPWVAPPSGARKASIDAELHDLREENLRLRTDIEKLRRLLIDSERRAH